MLRFCFNAAHDDEVTIVAADSCRAIGSDVERIDRPRINSLLFLCPYAGTTKTGVFVVPAYCTACATRAELSEKFLELMSKNLTARERVWLFAAETKRERLARFYHLWARPLSSYSHKLNPY